MIARSTATKRCAPSASRATPSIRSIQRNPRSKVFPRIKPSSMFPRSEEHTSELQSRLHLVCRLLLEKKKNDANDVEYDYATEGHAATAVPRLGQRALLSALWHSERQCQNPPCSGGCRVPVVSRADHR